MDTYRDLKEKLATFTDAQLDTPMQWSGDECGGNSVTLEVIKEEFRQTDDGMTPVSAHTAEGWEEIRADLTSGEFVIWPVGMPLLSVE